MLAVGGIPDRWRLLDDMIVCNSDLYETQRQLCFDLLGVPLALRDGTATVPAAVMNGMSALVNAAALSLKPTTVA